MAEVTFSNAAEADLVEIDEFSLAHFGEVASQIYMQGFTTAFSLLAQHPLAGEAKPLLTLRIRCLVHRQHRILYQVDGDDVLIVRVVHHAMDAKLALKGATE